MSKSTRGQISLRRIFSIFGAVVMPLAQLGFAEGTQRLVKDINPTLRSAAGSFPSELVTSADGPDVIKTWSTDGSGTSLLKDTSASLPRNSKRLATVGSQASTLAIHVTGMGTVASNPPGTNCSADCGGLFPGHCRDSKRNACFRVDLCRLERSLPGERRVRDRHDGRF